jgi:hypothetical protein
MLLPLEAHLLLTIHDLNIWMAIRDFSIFFEPVQTTATKKDISIVSGFNAITQYIEHVLKTQKGELISDMNLGADYFTYIFGTQDKAVLELNIAAYIEASIPQVRNVRANLVYYSTDVLQFEIFFSIYDGIQTQNNVSCFIEVET